MCANPAEKAEYSAIIFAMPTFIRTNSEHRDFLRLVTQLDAELAVRDGDEHGFYAQYNKVDTIRHVIVAYADGEPVSCGAIKAYENDVMEVKRMFTFEQHRGKGLAAQVLAELEKWAAEMGSSACILETGKRQPEAIALYTKCGYSITENYGQYAGVENSVCFRKALRTKEA